MSARAARSAWRRFPHPDKAYLYAEGRLKSHWPRLHCGDREPFPDARGLEALLGATEDDEHPLAGRAGGWKALAADMQQAWRLYHEGEFEQAARLGESLRLAGRCVASKATTVYANYLEPDSWRKLDLFESAAREAERAVAGMPDHANAHYLRAFALGRYSQGISVLVALSRGLGGKVKESLDRALELDPKHADAHIASGAYHAEIIDKVGGLVGGLTYGASKEEGLAHYRKAVELNPQSAIARIEYANGLLLMFGGGRRAEAERLYREAAEIKPADAMERLDVELAISLLR